MATDANHFFDGERWDRALVVEAQRARAVATADELGWELRPQSLLSEPLPLEVVEHFERHYGVALPPEYRTFLRQVGDGGDGPGLYLRPLGAPVDDSQPWEFGEFTDDPEDPNTLLAEPFPHTAAVMMPPEAATLQTTSGALFLFDHGSALWDVLIVTGAASGQIWLDRLADDEGLRPAPASAGGPRGFAEHYCRWLADGS